MVHITNKKQSKMKHGSLFSGIGGFDLAAEWMGWQNVFHCEWMDFPRKVLEYYWPEADSYTDICKTNFTKYENKIDILTGGFPCQPFSQAGKRKGREDERYLWGEMLRAIREIKPRFVIAENVRGITNIEGGLVFEQVCLDLEAEGYQVQPFIIPAAAKNAPHRRDRVWFIAYGKGDGFKECRKGTYEWKKHKQERSSIWDKFATNGTISNASNTDSNGFNQCDSEYEKQPSEGGINALNDIKQNDEQWNASNSDSTRVQGQPIDFGTREKIRQGGSCIKKISNFEYITNWQNFPTQSPICGGDDGLPTKLDGITFPKWRAESIKGYGNAIVPQIAFEIFNAIKNIQNEILQQG
jgi:DNA (cytosine-5)-methyltransferase 1